MARWVAGAVFLFVAVGFAEDLKPSKLTVLLGDRTAEVDYRPGDVQKKPDAPSLDSAAEVAATKLPNGLIRASDLQKVVGMELKDEGICSEQVCVPIPNRDALVRKYEDGAWIDLAELTRVLAMPAAFDAKRQVLALGKPNSAANRNVLESGIAPDFALSDRTGKTVRLSDFRGKKVFLFTWASWCACCRDLPGWQEVYASLPEGSCVFIAVAQDTAGESAAGPWYDKAKPTFVTLIDPGHRVTELYGMVNVPTGVWIDEEGILVRPREVAYSKTFRVLGQSVGDDRYAIGLVDWIKNGPKSSYWMSHDAIQKKLNPGEGRKPMEAALAFRVASHFHQQGDTPGAEQWWGEAQRLDPENWNYHRQAWSFEPRQAAMRWMKKVQSLNGRPYYEPVEFPE